jgi:putative transposase
MIDKTHQLSVRQQSQLIQINRSTLYYKPKEISSTDLSWMRLIDEIHLDYPFMGSRMIRDMLQRQGHQIGRRKVRRLMRLMGIHALYPKPNTSKPNLAHRIFPYLLKNMVIDHSNNRKLKKVEEFLKFRPPMISKPYVFVDNCNFEKI